MFELLDYSVFIHMNLASVQPCPLLPLHMTCIERDSNLIQESEVNAQRVTQGNRVVNQPELRNEYLISDTQGKVPGHSIHSIYTLPHSVYIYRTYSSKLYL